MDIIYISSSIIIFIIILIVGYVIIGKFQNEKPMVMRDTEVCDTFNKSSGINKRVTKEECKKMLPMLSQSFRFKCLNTNDKFYKTPFCDYVNKKIDEKVFYTACLKESSMDKKKCSATISMLK